MSTQRYVVLWGEAYYPQGSRDIIGAFGRIEDAVNKLKSITYTLQTGIPRDQWAEVFDLVEMRVVRSYQIYTRGLEEYGRLHFVEVTDE